MKACCVIILFNVFSTLIAVAHAQLLHPIEHIVGRWHVNLSRKDEHLLDVMVFPPQACTIPSIQESSGFITSTPRSRRSVRRQSLKCELILDPNGTFTLNPPTDGAINSFRRVDGMVSKINRLPLKGYWKLNPNPYCVTDRHYDELTLISNPKIRLNKHGVMPTICSNSSTKERVTLEMHCKVWGRFGSNTIRAFMKRPRARDAGRLTHGTLTIRKDTMNNDKQSSKQMIQKSRRVICATFHAKAWSQKLGNK